MRRRVPPGSNDQFKPAVLGANILNIFGSSQYLNFGNSTGAAGFGIRHRFEEGEAVRELGLDDAHVIGTMFRQGRCSVCTSCIRRQRKFREGRSWRPCWAASPSA